MKTIICIKKEAFLPWNLGRRMYTYNYTISNKNEKDEEEWIVVEFKRVMCHVHNEKGIYGVFPQYYISIRDKNYKDSIEIKNYHDAKKILKKAINHAIETLKNSEFEYDKNEEDENSIEKDISDWKVLSE